MGLKGSKTEQNLKDAFAGESQANRRYLYFANKADIEGQNDVAALFRSTAEGETGHAHGHLEFLEVVGDPATAAFRFSRLDPIGKPVAGSPTASRNSRWPCAWPVSPSAVERNSAATSFWPSMSALFAKYRSEERRVGKECA